ncbi:ATP-binding protein [Streptomyces cadmiisoli]|uniref:ATP-binding protein n=1 Tax=Streptomyces cadmiisoli TaxID=2184053 RepID=A0A2Z4JD00_9ACTN|nr:ATP-binding protein [Streptomyces cadmiisoli]AWW42628.1 ATP-binding protein [Streptomyces cadmiisoli]
MHGHEVSELPLRYVLPFYAVPAEVRLLRRAALRQMRDWGVLAAVDDAELIVTELATNVMKHVGEGASATLVLERRGDRLRVEVHDMSKAMPSPGPMACGDECGRGLHLVAALAADWGTALTATGKSVWCEIPAGAGRGRLGFERAAAALDSYQSVGSSAAPGGPAPDAGREQSVVELIADLLYWSAARGDEPGEILDRAQTRYEAEAGAAQ